MFLLQCGAEEFRGIPNRDGVMTNLVWAAGGLRVGKQYS
jgi:hypothetical protein